MLSSRSSKAPSVQLGLEIVYLRSCSSNSSSVVWERPQSVCWTIMTLFVPSRCCEAESDRSVSALTIPPAFRITCASPSTMPSIAWGVTRASMQTTIATPSRG